MHWLETLPFELTKTYDCIIYIIPTNQFILELGPLSALSISYDNLQPQEIEVRIRNLSLSLSLSLSHTHTFPNHLLYKLAQILYEVIKTDFQKVIKAIQSNPPLVHFIHFIKDGQIE